jgi:hypothetical protein
MVRHISSPLYMLLLVTHSFAHMVLQSPVPYGNAMRNNSPLDNSSLDFPYKQRESVYDVTQMNEWKVGEKKTYNLRVLRFMVAVPASFLSRRIRLRRALVSGRSSTVL